jgi:hypothetical protein
MYLSRKFGLVAALLAVSCLTGTVSGGDKAPRKGKQKMHATQRLVLEGNNDNQGWKVTVNVDKDDKEYAVGDEVVVTVKSEKEGYLYLINTDPKGNITVVFPNPYQKDNRIKAGEEIVVPNPRGKTFRFRTSDEGKEMLTAIVLPSPLKAIKAEELTGGRGPKELSRKDYARLAVEAITGSPTGTGTGTVDGSPGSIQAQKTRYKKDNPVQYEQKCKLWASATVAFNVSEGKKKPDQVDKKNKK